MLRLLAGELDPGRGPRSHGPDRGRWRISPSSWTTSIPSYGCSPPSRRWSESARTADGELSATSLLERFGFTGDRLTTRIGDLSGGERRRLQLLRLLMEEPNVLLLDEPTNDLDIETLTVVEDYLDRWPGTLVVVSHDRYFLERVCDSVWSLLGDGQVRMLPRGVDEYLERRASALAAEDALLATRAEPPPARTSSAVEREARKAMARVERQLDRLTLREAELQEALHAHATDPGKLLELDQEFRSLAERRTTLEEEWLAAADQAEP